MSDITQTETGTATETSSIFRSGSPGRPPFHNQHAYSVEQEKLRHDDAVHWYGEMTAFVLMWHIVDLEAGRVGRCEECYKSYSPITDVYQQPSKNRCPSCYGTTFEGGYRALLYRPALWDHSHISENYEQRGSVTRQTASIQPSTDFEMRDNDYVIRADNTRWRITQPRQTEVTTGFGTKATWPNVVTSIIEAQLEDPSSVVYDIAPIDFDFLGQIGWKPVLPYPVTPPDRINGPLSLD